MSVLPVHSLPKSAHFLKDVSLRQLSRELTIDEVQQDWVKDIVFDLFETLYSTGSGVGLAAPQTGIFLRIIVVDTRRDGKKATALINPRYIPIGNETLTSSEGCLSVPGVSGIVNRFNSIRVEYLDLNGELHSRDVSGFESTVLQHEIDHLNGVLYIDRVESNDALMKVATRSEQIAKKAMNKVLGGEA